uniref:SZT2 subunit of KICSTOR complex n=1 Tax=Scleropages formosus TaxID=113540 RepID=A0A8C9RR21_SCLFO
MVTELLIQVNIMSFQGMQTTTDRESYSCIVQYILFPPHSTSTKDSFSTDDDNDTEVEAIDLDTELNLVTECWIEPQCGVVWSSSEQHRHLQGLTYQEIPQAIFPQDLICMSTMMTFEYLSQLCQNKGQVYPLCGASSVGGNMTGTDECIQMVPFQFDLIKLLPKCQQIEISFLTLVELEDQPPSSSCLPNELLVSLFHNCLQQDLSDREIPLTDADNVTFMQHIIQRTQNGHLTPPSRPATQSPHWKCYAKYVNPHQIFLIFLPSTFAGLEEKDRVKFAEPQKPDVHIPFGWQVSQQSSTDLPRPRCPVYVYNCSLDSLKEQLVHPNSNRQPSDILFRYLHSFHSTSWTELIAHPHKHKELANYCSLLQEHYHQCYVKGVYRSLEQSYKVSSQDVLTAMDYCEESLQEIDLSPFLHTLCGHLRIFREQHEQCVSTETPGLPSTAAAFIIGDADEEGATERGPMDTEDISEAESRGKPSFPLSTFQLQQHCEVYPGLHKIIQDKFLEIASQYLKTVPSNPHYFFYCPPSAKKEDSDNDENRRPSEEAEVSEAEFATEDGENVSGCCIVTESDIDLEVEYREQADKTFPDNESVTDSNTVNQEEDSFSILEGDSLLEPEGEESEMPPLFVHLTCSVNIRSSHGSMPVQTLPTCLGEVIACLENVESLQSIELNDLSVTLDVFVLTLPLEIEVMSTDFHHNRYASESSVSLNRSPAQPSSYRSDDELGGAIDGLCGVEIRWLLEDEIVSALRHSRVINTSVLQKVADHVYCSSGRPQCHYEVVPLQFVFGPEQSLEKFKEEFRRISLTGYLLNAEQDNFYYVSLSRLHSLKLEVTGKQPASILNTHEKGKASEQASNCEEVEDVARVIPNENETGKGQDSQMETEKMQQRLYLLLALASFSSFCFCLGYDGGSSESECEDSTKDEQEPRCPLMPEFWIIVKIDQDRVVVYSHSSQENIMGETEKEDDEMPEHLQLHQIVVRKIGEMCRIVNQRLLLQDLHDSHVCNSLLVAESEEDIWKNESLYRQRMTNSDDYTTEENYQPRNYLAATMQFMPGHFACDVVWSTVIPIHSRLKMGPNMGVSRAIQALRSVLNAFCVVNRKNMFVYQERTTKSVFYLRLSETHQTGKVSDLDGNSLHVSRSVGLARSQEPVFTEDLLVIFTGSRSSLEGSRPIGQVDKHILLRVHGVSQAGPEITDELVKVLRKRLDEATLDIITVMLVRNCKLTPSDVEFIQPPGSASTEVIAFLLPQYSLPWIQAVAHYLRQNLLIFLHIPKYTDSNIEHHFKHYFHLNCELPDSDIYLYNKPGGQGTGGKVILPALVIFSVQIFCLTSDNDFFLTEAQICVRFDIWEQGNVSPLELTDKLQGALRHALCDVIMELKVLPNPLCLETFCFSSSPFTLTPAPSTTPSTGTNTPESTTPTGKTVRRSFWEILSKPDPAELGSPKTTDDIVPERGEDSRVARRRHKTENVKQQWSQEKIMATELEQAQRRHVTQLEEGDTGTLHQVYQGTCQSWVNFMAKLGCPSIQQCTVEIASLFLLPSILMEIMNLVSSFASDTTMKAFERTRYPQGNTFVPLIHHPNKPFPTSGHFILIGRNFHQWRYSTEQVYLTPCVSPPQVTLCIYNWSVDLGASLIRELIRLVQWQNARSHVVHCLLSQKMGLFHHCCFSDPPANEDLKQEPNPFLNSTLDADALLRSPVPPVPSKDQGRLSSSGRNLHLMHFPHELVPFDEALREISISRAIACMHDSASGMDTVSWHGAQLLEIKAAERREMEKQMKIENLFVTWQQRSAQSNMPISVADLDTLKQSSRLVHYCATPLLFDPIFPACPEWRRGKPEPNPPTQGARGEGTHPGRDASLCNTDAADMLPSRLREEAWLQDISNTFLQQYVQYLQSIGFILVQVRPPSPMRSIARARAAAFSSHSTEGRASFSYNKQKSEESPKSSGLGTTAYHLQRALPGGIVLMELAFQGCYFCVKQYALECSRIPMGQTVNSQLSMLFTEECDKVRDLMHVHSFSYDFHLRVVHQYLVGCHMTLRQGYQLTSFLEDFMAHHPDIPKFGRNHVFQGSYSVSTDMITAHQLYNYITDHAGTYGMKPLRMSKAATITDSKKGGQSTDLHEYALVAHWNSSGSYKDLEGLRHHDDFDVSLLVCHNAAPFEEQSEEERHLLRLCYYVIMTSQRELFPRLTADMQRFKKLPVPPLLCYFSPLFPLLNSEVNYAQRQIQTSVEQAMGHCRRDNLWRRLFHGEHLASDKLKLSKLSFGELEELLGAVQSESIGDIDPQLDCFLTMSPGWYQSLIKVLLQRFPQSCRHFVDDSGIQYLAVLNQKFTDCFVLVFLDTPAGKTSLKVVFREPLPSHTQPSNSPLPQLVSMYHHLESVINTACFNLWTGLLT